MDASKAIREEHLAEAVVYRGLDHDSLHKSKIGLG
jgi:hypothetical protein